MKLNKIGEFGLIDRFKKLIKNDSSVIVGSGDDCAVLKFNKKYYQLFTCDMITEGVDFTKDADPYLVGRKAVAVSLSDIASCAGIPQHTVISLGIPKDYSVEKVDRLSKGIIGIADKFKVNIVGGDISRASALTIDVSMLGIVEKSKLILRDGSREADIIFVTGALGGSINGKHLRFSPRVKEARKLVDNFKINSMIDISDGLIADLAHILKQSKKGAVLYESLIPLAKEAAGISDALYSGEDFELLFTLSRKEAARLLASYPNEFMPIGEVMNKEYGIVFVDKNNREKKVTQKGFRHF